MKYGDVVLPPITFMVDCTMNLINGIYHECERSEHHVIMLQEHLIITRDA